MSQLISVKKYKPGTVWYAYWRDFADRKHKKSLGTKDQTVAEIRRRELEQSLALGKALPKAVDGTRTVGDVRDEFLERYAKVETKDAYRYSLRAFENSLKDKRLVAIDDRVVDAFKIKRAKEVAVATLNKDLRHTKRFLAWCREQRYLAEVPMIKQNVEERRLPVSIPQGYLPKLLAATTETELRLPTGWWSNFLGLLFFSGCRRGELLKLKWSQVDLGEQPSLLILVGTSKGTTEKRFGLLPEQVKSLTEWRESVEGDLVFPHKGSRRTLYLDLQALCVKAGVPYKRFKDFRSGCGTRLVEAGVPMTAVSAWLGHSSVVVTERHYANVGSALPLAQKAMTLIMAGESASTPDAAATDAGTIPGTTEQPKTP